MKKVIAVIGGGLIIASMFLDFFTSEFMNFTGLEYFTKFEVNANKTFLGYVFIGIGAAMAIFGVLNNRALHMLNVLLGLAVAGMGVKIGRAHV